MRALRNQHTLARSCRVSGRGYWSGRVNTLTFSPADADTGIVFVRDDIFGEPSVKAVAENSVGLPLRTRLTNGRAEVDMIEHVMAALYGLQIDNVFVHCTSGEMPGLDGSSMQYVLALQAAGRLEQRVARKTLWLDEPIVVGDAENYVCLEPLDFDSAASNAAIDNGTCPTSALTAKYTLAYDVAGPIANATYECDVTPQSFADNIAAARTFVTKPEADALQARGLGAHVTERDLLVFGDSGPINNQLRFTDECARHKMLDLLGDLALVGVDLVGRLTACRSGHQLNGQMADRLRHLWLENDSPKIHSGQQAA